jgi:pimeloyl-ACP methyl ester carboxylesterase
MSHRPYVAIIHLRLPSALGLDPDRFSLGDCTFVGCFIVYVDVRSIPRCLSALVLVGATLAPCARLWAQGGNAEELRRLSSTLDLLRARNAADYAISTPNGIDESRYLKIGGIDQWVTIRGEDRANPVVLVLHGGPGDATNPWGYAGFRTWLKTYTVVQWDQRGAGRTFGRNGKASASMLTIDQLVQDGVELADALRTLLQKDKIILLAHSWGSVLGVLMAKAKPDLFSAYVGTGQVADPLRGYHVAFDALLAKARALNEARALLELQEIGPPPYKDGRGYRVQRRWANLFEGAVAFIASMLGMSMTAPGYTVRDVNDWIDGQRLSAAQLVPQSSALSATALTGRFALPVFVIHGSEDFTTPTSLAKEFIERLEAPQKTFATIQGGHFAAFTNSSDFLTELGRLLVKVRQ